jgi:hypothetical protein
MASEPSHPPAQPVWRIVEIVDGERQPYLSGGSEWHGSERRAKSLADSLSMKGRLFVAELSPAEPITRGA